MQAEIKAESKKPETRRKYDVIIIGAGPAGYTASIYTSRAKRDTLIISGVLPGGQLMLTTEVENYPGFSDGIFGPELMIEMKKQAERMGTTIIDDEVVNVDFRHKPFKVLTYSEEYEADAVIICTGASPRKIGVKGEQEFSAKGVSYCATCDGPFFKNQDIVVVGGGDSAVEEATFLTKFGKLVHLVHRKDSLRASKIMQERAFNNQKIKFYWNKVIEEISGNDKVNQIIIKDVVTNEKQTLSVGALFVAIGHEPNTKLFKGQIELDEQGYIVLKDNTKTSVIGVFAAGDVHDHRYRQAVTAAGFGCMAAIDVDKYLSENKK
ncbi:MAG TPA: thioredoxin-disulfide reductase [Nitrosopumilaceae archaeon]|nr:thioredoxin-disulfide reductase [Nitrosopumilaceae archaeon]